MALEWHGRALFITRLPLSSMGRLASCAPLTPNELETLAALLAGARVYLAPEALEYRTFRRTAPSEMYRRCLSLERTLREMGVRKAPGKHNNLY